MSEKSKHDMPSFMGIISILNTNGFPHGEQRDKLLNQIDLFVEEMHQSQLRDELIAFGKTIFTKRLEPIVEKKVDQYLKAKENEN